MPARSNRSPSTCDTLAEWHEQHAKYYEKRADKTVSLSDQSEFIRVAGFHADTAYELRGEAADKRRRRFLTLLSHAFTAAVLASILALCIPRG